jgi:hypothetical protein
MPSIVVKSSDIHNKGVFAAKDFDKGELVLKWNPRIITKEEIKNLPESEKKFTSNYKPGEYLLQNKPERYVNHSCNPNTEVVNNCDIALKSIKKGEEITSDYCKDGIVFPFECKCGSKNCRKSIK